MVRQERPELVACQPSNRPVGSGTATARRSASGSFGKDEVGVEPDGIGKREVERPGLLRVRERNSREVRVRRSLRGDDRHRPEARLCQELRKHLTADAVQGRVDDPELARRPAGSRWDESRVAGTRSRSSASSMVSTLVVAAEAFGRGRWPAIGGAAAASAMTASSGGITWAPSAV